MNYAWEYDMDQPRSKTRHYRLFLICLLLFVTTACASPDSSPTGEPGTLAGGTAMLSWDPSVGPDIVGYKVYLATASGAYGAPIATLAPDATSYTATGLEAGSTYFFVVTAYNSDGAESSFSNEVNKTII
jgi:hypothetical protein